MERTFSRNPVRWSGRGFFVGGVVWERRGSGESEEAGDVALGCFDEEDAEVAGDVGGKAGEEGMRGIEREEADEVEPKGIEEEEEKGPCGLGIELEGEIGEAAVFGDLGIVLVMREGEEEGKAHDAGPENGAGAGSDDEVAAEDDLFDDTGSNHGEEKEGGDITLLIGDAEGDFAAGFEADQGECTEDGD